MKLLSSLRFFNHGFLYQTHVPSTTKRYYIIKMHDLEFPNFYIKLHFTWHNHTVQSSSHETSTILFWIISLQSTLPIDLFKIFPHWYCIPILPSQHLGRRCHDLEFKVQAWTSCNRFHRLFVAQEWCKPGFQRVCTLYNLVQHLRY